LSDANIFRVWQIIGNFPSITLAVTAHTEVEKENNYVYDNPWENFDLCDSHYRADARPASAWANQQHRR
jgi:hypothetical protein